MPGEEASYFRPKTRSRNKLRLNMKKLLNPRLYTNEVTVLDDVSPEKNPEIKKSSRKGKKPAAVKVPYVHPVEVKSSSRSLEDSSKPAFKLSEMFFEIRSDLLKQPQLKKEVPSVEVTGEENPSIVDTPANLLIDDADIFKRLNIPWRPTDEQ